jgi:SecD/SecF fusion protein
VNGAIESEGLSGIVVSADSPDYRPGSSARLKNWTIKLGGADQATAQRVFSRLENDVEKMAMFPLASKIGGRVSNEMQLDALKALFISLLGVIVYLWVRFTKLTYGVAAAVALVHDVLITIGMLAISKYIVEAVPGLASALQLDSFQISLTIVAALLTIIGYSINDTIVTFDRLREIKGKSPRLTANMVNSAVNQCLSRTILTALTVFMTVVILYFFGGEGIHGFAFAFLIGVVAGTYSTVYIAAPVLLWLSGESADIVPATD